MMMVGNRNLKVGVIGGGSAGYLAALALRVRCPEIQVTLLHSSRAPAIGVGEGTTPAMLPFLHSYLGFDIEEFIANVQPTWKLGVQLDWGPKGGLPFQFPFAAPYLIDSYVRTGTINQSGFVAELMNQGAGLHMLSSDLTIRSLTGFVPFAYHLDNHRFVSYLEQKSKESDICLIDAHLISYSFQDNGALAAVIAEDGRQFAFDLFIDSTGFRSALLGDAMGVAFKSYQSSLFANAALVGTSPHHTDLAPFTRSDTLDAGWCWSVPQIHEDRRGYVFSSDHISIDSAEMEMRHHCPELADLRLIHFTPGRRECWWKHNVVAIGNAYGFVEPLQATALHMIIHEIVVFVNCVQSGQCHESSHRDVNVHIASIWDGICALIALHYRYNYRRESPFWQDARIHTNLGILEPVIDEAIQIGSMTRLVDLGLTTLPYGLAHDIDLILLGFQLVAKNTLKTRLSDTDWFHLQRRLQGLGGFSLSTATSIKISREREGTIQILDAPWFQSIVASLENPFTAEIGLRNDVDYHKK